LGKAGGQRCNISKHGSLNFRCHLDGGEHQIEPSFQGCLRMMFICPDSTLHVQFTWHRPSSTPIRTAPMSTAGKKKPFESSSGSGPRRKRSSWKMYVMSDHAACYMICDLMQLAQQLLWEECATLQWICDMCRVYSLHAGSTNYSSPEGWPTLLWRSQGRNT